MVTDELTILLIRSNIEVLKLRLADELMKTGPGTWKMDMERMAPLRKIVADLEESLIRMQKESRTEEGL